MELLLIDDEPIFRKGLAKLIQKNTTYIETIYQADSAKEALNQVKEHPNVTIAFVDINLPDINGLDLIKQLKTFNPQMLLVVISGYDDFAYARQAIQLNVFDYLLKPLAPSDVRLLLQKIEQKILHQTSSQVKNEQLSALSAATIYIINERYAQPDLTLTSVAAQLFVDTSYLSKQLKRDTGKSFNDYLTTFRIEKAKELLTQSDLHWPIQEIGERVGYPNPHYFSRIFKQHTQKTPTEYRQSR
ncbi:response regulator [Vagococcus lutrae]|uniref:response regulator transcription factor n=1 Tax=Vagococcus lutrae TaxID=81947 RepID=UPI00209823FA|nr:response regulator [Vagococcus lutrae]MCO7150201.1 response regulator [Vagococcus lutrae]MDT2818306.1 response regulator [Vagococcus lutrae]MDT2843127.1 response regulator [Vagococcus lutrae]WCG05602.1 response regulator [Vagococcus lutrae]